jgi:hypothetical protein
LFSLQAHLVVRSGAPEQAAEALAAATGAALVPPGNLDFTRQEAVSPVSQKHACKCGPADLL